MAQGEGSVADRDSIDALMRGRHDAIGAARDWFLDNGFDIDGDDAVASSGYGEGGIVVEIKPLVGAVLQSVIASIGRELIGSRNDHVLTQADFDEVYRRMRVAFVGEDCLPPVGK